MHKIMGNTSIAYCHSILPHLQLLLGVDCCQVSEACRQSIVCACYTHEPAQKAPISRGICASYARGHVTADGRQVLATQGPQTHITGGVQVHSAQGHLSQHQLSYLQGSIQLPAPHATVDPVSEHINNAAKYDLQHTAIAVADLRLSDANDEETTLNLRDQLIHSRCTDSRYVKHVFGSASLM